VDWEDPTRSGVCRSQGSVDANGSLTEPSKELGHVGNLAARESVIDFPISSDIRNEMSWRRASISLNV
jgi:hypothetical protein